MKMFYRGICFGMRAVMLVTPNAAGLLVQEGFGSKESLFQWLKDNTFETEKSEQTEMELDIIVVGGPIHAYQLGNMYYITTASVDGWR